MKQTPGTLVRIQLADSSFAYAMELESPYTAFYDYRTLEPSVDLDTICAKPILFRLAVEGNVADYWDVIGWHPVEGDAAAPVLQFMQDLADYRKCTLFDSVGTEREVTPEECIGIERAVVWRHDHVEQRLLDKFLDRANGDEQRYRVRLT
jgi:hypothetical protein